MCERLAICRVLCPDLNRLREENEAAVETLTQRHQQQRQDLLDELLQLKLSHEREVVEIRASNCKTCRAR